eukprot:gene4069-5094_t
MKQSSSSSSSSSSTTTPVNEIKKVETNLKRLIQSCETILSNDSSSPTPSSSSPPTSSSSSSPTTTSCTTIKESSSSSSSSSSTSKMLSIVEDPTFTVERYIPVMVSQLRHLKDLIENKIKLNAKLINPDHLNNNNNNNSSSTFSSFTSSLSFSSSSSSNNNTATTQSDIITTSSDEYYPSKEKLAEYSRKIDVIVGLVNKEKMNSPISSGLSIIRLQASNIDHSKKMDEVHTISKTRNKEGKKRIEQLLQPHLKQSRDINNSSGFDSKGINNNSKSTFKTNSDLEELLGGSKSKKSKDETDQEMDNLLDQDITQRTKRQRYIQKQYIDELLTISDDLNIHSNTMHLKLDEDDKKLDELSESLTSNRSKITTQNQRLKDHISSTSRDTLNYCIIIVIVMITFFFTYLFIKLNAKQI